MASSLEKTLMPGKIEGERRRGRQRMRRSDGITDSMDMSLSKLREMAKNRVAWRAAVYGIAKSQTRLNDLTTTSCQQCFKLMCEQVDRRVSGSPALWGPPDH